MNIENEINNSNEINNTQNLMQEKQNNFLETTLGKTINAAINIGLR